MRNIKMIVAYVGTRYAGWQVQPGRATIQGVLETRLSTMLAEKVAIAGAGRTDAGVHARGQVANFSTASRVPVSGLVRGLNALLPEDIRVMKAEEAPGSFHARSDARSKEYHYVIACGPVVSPFLLPFADWVRGPLDLPAMAAAARALLGRHDFTSLCPAGCRIENRERCVTLSEIEDRGDRLEYRVRADGFLHHMVRTIVGTLVWVGRGRLDAAAIPAMLEARDRTRAGPCAPGRGLTLERVFYEEGA
jgi:tRNA pseudouridine38-40 synthase